MEINIKKIAEKMIEAEKEEKANWPGFKIEEFWTNTLMDILEDLYELETKVSNNVEEIKAR